MDDFWFDAIAKSFPVRSRRHLFTFISAAVASLGASQDVEGRDKKRKRARGQRKRKPKCVANRKPCKANAQCCSKTCEKKGQCTKKGKLTGKCKCKAVAPKPGPTPPPPTGGAGGLQLPVPAGHRTNITHGYDDPQFPGWTSPSCRIGTTLDHCNNQKYGIDFTTTTREAVAPASGRVHIVSEFIFLDLQNGDGVGMSIGHFTSYRVANGAQVRAGDCLGTIGTHFHISLDRRWNSNGSQRPLPFEPIPFSGSYKLEGHNLAPDGSSDQQCWSNVCDFVSTNSGRCPTSGTFLHIEAAVVDPLNGRSIFEGRRPAHEAIDVQVAAWRDRVETRRTGRLTFDSNREAFIGAVDFGLSLLTAEHAIYIKFRDRARTKWSSVHNVQVIQNTMTVVPRFTVTPADANDDGEITSADYDLIASCYTFPGQPETCADNRAADIDLNGTVNEFDLNLYTRVAQSEL